MEKSPNEEKSPDLAQVAEGRKNRGAIAELLELLAENKAYWLIPIVLVMLALGVLLIIGGSQMAPFIYSLF